MAIVREQYKAGQSSGGTSGYNLAFDTNITADSLLICVVSAYLNGGSDPPFTVTDNNSNTWVELYDTLYDGSVEGAYYGYVVGANSGATTVTINSNATFDEYFGVVLIEVSGIATTTPVDVNAAQTTTSSSWSSTNITTTENDTYMLGFLALDNGNQTLTEDGAFTLVAEYQDGNSGMPYSCGERILTSTVTDAYTGTIGSSSEYWSGIAAFKASGGGGGDPTGFMTTMTGYWGP